MCTCIYVIYIYIYIYIYNIIYMFIYHNNTLSSIYTYIYFTNNYHPILAIYLHLCEAPESNTIDSGAIQIHSIIIIIMPQ